MRILLTNDDGFDAPGMAVLREIAAELSDEVWVVAPEVDQSAKSHSLTLQEPLRCRKVEDRVFAVKGTPTDCVIMATKHLMADAPPDLILSGVNRGQNIADDVHYSGTIAAAKEGVLLGFKSIALSQAMRGAPPVWETPRKRGPGLVRRLLETGWPHDIVMNVNFPAVAPDAVAGEAIVSQGRRDQGLLSIDARMDNRGVDYYWFAFERHRSTPVEGTDIWAIETGRIAITPLHLDLTHGPTREDMEAGWAAPDNV